MHYRKHLFLFVLLFINCVSCLHSEVDIFVDHDSRAWLKQYERADALIKSKKAEDKALGQMRKKTLLCDIFRDTKWAITYGFLVDDDEVQLDPTQIVEIQLNTQVINEPTRIPSLRPRNIAAKVIVYNDDTIEVAEELLKKHGRSPLVLNIASATIPGSKVEVGAEGQEESLFRRSSYYKALLPSENVTLKKQLSKGRYQIPEFGVIYTPGVTFFRTCKKEGFSFCKPWSIDMVATAAYDLNNEPLQVLNSQDAYEANTKEKIRAILRTAYSTKHNTLVLGAFGCGAQKNNPVIVSRLFKEVFQEVEFQGVFLEIAFAIYDDMSADSYTHFKNTLHGLRV